MPFLTFPTCERACAVRQIADALELSLGDSYFLPRAGDVLWFALIYKDSRKNTLLLYCTPDMLLAEIGPTKTHGSVVMSVEDAAGLLSNLKEHVRPLTETESNYYWKFLKEGF